MTQYGDYVIHQKSATLSFHLTIKSKNKTLSPLGVHCKLCLSTTSHNLKWVQITCIGTIWIKTYSNPPNQKLISPEKIIVLEKQ